MKSSDREARRAPRGEHESGASEGPAGAPQEPGAPTPAGDVRPLSAAERAAFSAQEAALADLNQREKGSRLIPWEQGAAVLSAKRNGYHDRVFPEKFRCAASYVASRLDKSYDTLRRRAKMAEVYDQEQFLAWRARRVCVSILELLADAPTALRGALEEIAREGATYAQLSQALVAGRAALTEGWLRQSPEFLGIEMKRALLREQEKDLHDGVVASLCPRCGEHMDETAQALKDERRQAAREGGATINAGGVAGAAGAEALAAVVQEKDAQIQAQAVLLKDQESRLREQTTTIQGQDATVKSLRLELQHKDQRIEAQQAEIQQLIVRIQEQAERQSAAPNSCESQQFSAQTTAPATPDSCESQQFSAPSAAPFAQARIEDLFEREQQVQRKEAQLDQLAADLLEKEAVLYSAADQLRALQKQMILEDTRLRDERVGLTELRDTLHNLEARLCHIESQRPDGGFHWQAPPESLIGVIIYLSDGLDNLCYVAAQAFQEHFHGRGARLEPGQVAVTLNLGRQLGRAEDAVKELGLALLRAYGNRYPKKAEAEHLAWEAELARTAPGATSGINNLINAAVSPAEDPATGFSVPIAAIVGTNRPFVNDRGLLALTPDGQGVLINLSRPQTMLVTGQPGSGKTHLLLVLLEMYLSAIPKVSTTRRRVLVVWFHLGQSSRDYPADIATATGPNTGPRARERLRSLGIDPQGLPGRRVVLVPPDQDMATLERRKQEYPGAEIRVLRLRKKDRFPGMLRILMSAESNDSDYLRFLEEEMLKQGAAATPQTLHESVDGNKRFDKRTKARAHAMVDRAAKWLAREGSDEGSLFDDLDDALVIVDLRSDKETPDEQLSLVMALLGVLSQLRDKDGDFRWVFAVIDEFNKIIRRRELAVEVLSLLTEVRHRKTTIVFACQLPEEYPTLAGNVLTGLIVGRIEGERSYNALAAMKPAIKKYSREHLAKLLPGRVALLFGDASTPSFRGEPHIVEIRPACAQPGGQTRGATPEDEGED